MTLTTDQLLIAGLAVLVLLLLGYIVGSRGRARPPAKPDATPVTLPPGAEALAPAFAELRTQLGDLRGQIEELRRADVAALGPLATLPTAQTALQGQVSDALRDLAAVRQQQAEERQRWERENAAFDGLQRLTAMLLGSATSGATGERLVQGMLDALPAQWRVTNHTVNGKRVEFAVRLPDGLFLPIDSKVVAQAELDALERASDAAKREQLERKIRDELLARAREVEKYLDDRSVDFAIAAVSDAAYRLSGPVLSRAYQEYRALLVPYSLLAPFVLMVYEQHRHGRDLDTAQMDRLLVEAQRRLEGAATVLNSHLGGALTQLSNAREKLAGELAAAARALEQIRGTDENASA